MRRWLSVLMLLPCFWLACRADWQDFATKPGGGDSGNSSPNNSEVTSEPTTPGGATPAAPGKIPVSIGAFLTTSPAAMSEMLQTDLDNETGYRLWAHNKVHYLITLNLFGASFVDAAMKTAMDTGAGKFPLGSCSVLELYSDEAGKHLVGWAILAKGSLKESPQSWFTFELHADKAKTHQPSVNSMGAKDCSVCHDTKSAPGYVIPITF